MRNLFTAYLIALLVMATPSYASGGSVVITLSSPQMHAGKTPDTGIVFHAGAAHINADASVDAAGKTRFAFTWYAPDGTVRFSIVKLAFPPRGASSAAASDRLKGPIPAGWWRLDVNAGNDTGSTEFLITEDDTTIRFYRSDREDKLSILAKLEDSHAGYLDILKLAFLDKDYDIRSAAVTSAARIGTAKTVDFIRAAASDGSYVVRAAVVRAAVTMPGTEGLDLIEPLAADPEPYVRLTLARSLGEKANKAAVSLSVATLAKLVRDADSSTREAALISLSVFEGDEATAALSNGFKVEAEAFRKDVLAELARRRGAIRTELLAGRLSDPSPEIRVAALRALVDAGGVWPVEKARPLVDDPDGKSALSAFELLSGTDEDASALALKSRHAQVRSAAIVHAIKRGGPSLAVILAEAADDEDAGVRETAVDGLAGLGAAGLPGLIVASGDTETPIRKKAVRAIHDTGASGAEDAMVKAASDQDPEIRLAALKYLVSRAYPGVYVLLGRAASDPSGEVGQAALDSLVAARAEAASGPLGAFYDAGDTVVRYRVVDALADRHDSAALEVLNRALDDTEPDIRVMAVEALAAAGHGADAARLALDPDKDIKRAALDAICVSPDPGMLPVLRQLLADPDTGIRIKALGALGRIKGAEAGESISMAVQDGERAVRELAVRLLVAREDEGAAAGLAALLDDSSADTRQKAADVLTNIRGDKVDSIVYNAFNTGGPRARMLALDVMKRRGSRLLPDVTVSALSDSDPLVREAALGTALSLDDDSRISAYKAAAGSTYPEVRLAAIDGLGDTPGGDVVEVFVNALSDEDTRVRLAAVDALAARRAPELSDRLAALLDDPDMAVAEEAYKASAIPGFITDRTDVLVKTATGLHKGLARDAMDKLIDAPDRRALAVYEEYFVSGYRRGDILAAAGSIDGDDVSRYIGGMYRSCPPGDTLKHRAVEVLAGRGEAALIVLAEALDDGSAEIRLAAVRSIAGLTAAGGRLEALGHAVRDINAEVRREALNAMSGMNEAGAAVFMLPALDDPVLRDDALIALEKAVVPSGVPELAGYVGNVKHPGMRAGFVRILSKNGLDNVALHGLLDDTAVEVQLEAVAALGARGGTEGAYGLFSAGAAKDPSVKQAALDALTGMEPASVEAGLSMHIERGTADEAMFGMAARAVNDKETLVRIARRLPESETSRLGAYLEPLLQRRAPDDVPALLDGLKAKDARLRSEILNGLAGFGPTVSEAAFINALSLYPGLGRNIITAASTHGLPAGVARAALGLDDPAARASAVAGLRAAPCPEMEDVLLKGLGDPEWGVRLASARRAAASGCIQPLARMAADASPEIRKEAVSGLAGLSQPEAIATLAHLASDKDDAVSGAAVGALKKKGVEVPPGVWAGLAGPSNPKNTRLAALKTVSDWKDAAHLPVLTEALKDRDPDIASAGVSGLAVAGRAAAGEVNRLISDPVAGPNALKVAGLIADPSSEGPVVQVLPKLEGGLLADAVDVLGRLGGEASVNPLIGVYRKGDTRLRLAVLKALSGLKISAVAPELSGLIAGAMVDPDDSIRFYAVRAAGSLGDVSLADTLNARLAVETSPLVSSEIRRSLDKLVTARSRQ